MRSTKNGTGHHESEFMDGITYKGNKGPTIGVRHLQVLLLAFIMGIAFSTKSMLSIAIVAMTDNTTSSNPNVPTYNWTNTSVIISSILWSGIAVNIIAGYLGKQYGPKWFTVGASMLNSLFFMLIPIAAQCGGSIGVILCRICQGLALGCLYPLQAVVMGRWIPPEERSRLGFVSVALLTLMLVISSIAIGYIASSQLGWPWIFYILGTFEVVLTILYVLLGVQSPKVHKTISAHEKMYLQKTISQTEDNERTPWKIIFSSMHFWAIIVGQSGFTFLLIMLSTEMSIYAAKVMQYDMKTNGTLSALPPLIGAISGTGISYLSDFIPKRGILSVVNSRRTFHLVGVTGISLLLISMTFVPIEYRSWAVALLCISNIFIVTAGVGGASTNILDVSPKFAGIIMGCSQMFGQTVSLFAPLLVQWICTDESDATEWRIVFVTTGSIAVGSGIFFAIFATGQRQNWGSETDKEAEMEIHKRKSSIISMTFGVGS